MIGFHCKDHNQVKLKSSDDKVKKLIGEWIFAPPQPKKKFYEEASPNSVKLIKNKTYS